MSSLKTISYGIIIMLAIYSIATFVGTKTPLKIEFFPSSFIIHLVMLLLSIITILTMKEKLNFYIALPKFKMLIKPFLMGVLITMVVNILMNISTVVVNGNGMSHPLLEKSNALQMFLFVFVFASIAEEILFRGFFQNSLNSVSNRGISILKCRFSIPVISSGIAFGLAHLMLVSAGVDYLFLIRMVLFTSMLGIAAGYYQDKYENNTSYAIVVHMGGNLFGVLSTFL